MLTILQSIKGLRQEGGHQNYESNQFIEACDPKYDKV